MQKRTVSFSQFLNISLGSIVLIGGFISFKYGNFGGVSFDALEEGYVSRKELKFSDLAPDLQKRYIDKDATIEQSKDGYLLEDEYLDDKGNPIPESDITTRDLKQMIKKLQKTLLFLQHDNLLTANEKNELARKIEELENEREDEKNAILNKNLDKINEAEQQHYKNISDLTVKINELQKENVIIAQRANVEANTLRGETESLKAKIIEEAEKKKQDIKIAREDEQSKLGDYKDRIKLLTDQIALLNEQISTNNETAKNAFSRKQDEIAKLKDEITSMNKEKNDILTKNAQAMVELDRKHNEEIAKFSKSMELLKAESEKLIVKNRQDIANIEEVNLKKLAIQEEKAKSIQMELASSQKHIDALMLENEKDFNKFRTYLEDEKKLNKELLATNKRIEDTAQSTEKTFNATLLKLNEELAKKEANIKGLGDKIIALNNEKQNFDSEVKKKIDENDKIHNKNYKIFNEKIASFETSKRESLERLDQQLNQYKETAKDTYDKIQYHVNELTKSNNELKLKNEGKEKETLELQTQLTALQNNTQKIKESEEVKVTQMKSAFNELKDTLKSKEAEYLGKISVLENEARSKETALTSAKKDETLKIAALEKEIKSKELQIQSIKDQLGRNEDTLKALHVTIKEADANATKATNKQIEDLKAKLALIEKNRISEDDKMVGLKDDLKRREIEYLDNIKALQKEIKTKEAQVQASKDESKKIELGKLANEEKSNKLKDEFKQRELGYLDTIKALESDKKSKETQLGSSKKDETLKVLALEKELKTKDATLQSTKDELTKHLASSEQTMKTLNEKIKTLESSTPKIATKAPTTETVKTTTSSNQKLVMLDKVTCEDMGTGINAISDTCKKNVADFLAKYDNSYYFEVAPIVDNGGFASLKLIKNKKVGVEDTEIDRISGLANIGLGKARAKAGGEMVTSKIGEGAKISYTLSNIEQDKARGFQIRVYK